MRSKLKNNLTTYQAKDLAASNERVFIERLVDGKIKRLTVFWVNVNNKTFGAGVGSWASQYNFEDGSDFFNYKKSEQ